MPNMIEVAQRTEKTIIPLVDDWNMLDEDKLFNETKGAIIAPIHLFYNLPENNHIDYFHISIKKCYNSDTSKTVDSNGVPVIKYGFREHLIRYINYFEKFYDRDHLLLAIYANIKCCIDSLGSNYTLDTFITDLNRYIILPEYNEILHYYIKTMNHDNYIKMTSQKKDTRNPCLEYHDIHAELLMMASLYECFMIPLVSHFMHINRVPNIEVKNILMKAFDNVYVMILRKYGVDLYAKLMETIYANVGKSNARDSQLWEMQAMRAINPDVHAINSLENLVIQIVPKYVYNQSVVCFNYNAILKEIKYKVTEIPYEFRMVPVISSIRDEDNNSQTDKFESYLIKQNESLSIQYKVNAFTTMNQIEMKYGPFNDAEIDHYIHRLSSNGRKYIKNQFQSYLVNYLFMKDFGDTDSIKFVNNREYVMLMIAAKRLLRSKGLITLSEIIGGRVEKTVARKSVNKTMSLRMKMSEQYEKVLNKYKIESLIEDTLFGFIAQITASEFSYIDFYNPNIDGKIIEINRDLICEEFLSYSLMI